MSANWEGDVASYDEADALFGNPGGDFPALGAADTNNDGEVDGLTSGGNFLYTEDAHPTDPEGTTDDDAWDSVRIWRNWDSPYSVKIGANGQAGELSLSSQHKLRIMNLSIGEAVGSIGTFTVSGFGTLFCSDRDAFPQWVRDAISLATGGSIVPAAVTYDDLGNEDDHPYAGHVKVEQPAGNYNLWVGKAGSGYASISSGGVVEVRHQVIVGGYYDGATLVAGQHGQLNIAGQGSLVFVHGKFLADTGIPTAVTAAKPMQVTTAGVVLLSQGTLYSRTGIVNAGVIEAYGAYGEHSIISAGEWEYDEEVIHVGELVNTGLIRVREGATLKLNCPLTNTGEIYLESGATLNCSAGILVAGVIRRAPCGPAAILIDEGAITIPEAVAVEMIA